MPYSKFSSSELEFNEDEWVVSLINTKVGILNVFGGHAKIVVEGVKKTDGLFTELFIGEYHIMEAEQLPQQSWVPQALRNTKSKYAVLISERSDYSARQEQQYSEVASRSDGGLKPEAVMKMIRTIKQEQGEIKESERESKFQYAGKWCVYSYDGGHNCTTWAEEKLDIIGIGKHPITDSSKAAPFVHVNMKGRCIIL